MLKGSSRSTLSLKTKLLYAQSSLGENALFQSMVMWLVYFYAPPPEAQRPVLVPIALIGTILGIGRFLESFDDPLIGHWSDTFRSRLGRRVPFILFGTPLLVVSFSLLWMPPIGADSLFLSLYFFVLLEGFYLINTIVGAPLSAVLPEIAHTSAERVSVSAWKVVFGILGAAIGLVVSGPLIAWVGFATMGITMAVVTLASYYAALGGIWGKTQLQQAEIPFVHALRITLTNRHFLGFAASVVFFNMGLNFLTQLMPYFVRVIMGQGEAWVSLFTVVVMVLVILALPLMARLAVIKGKRWTYSLAMIVVALYFPGLFFAGFVPGVERLIQGLVYVGLSGIPMTALFLFPNALLSDVIDHDETQTGQRREGMYFGMLATLQKLAFALSAILFGLVLQVGGYSAEEPLGLRLVGPIAGVCVLLGWALFRWGYRLPETVVAP